MPISTGGLSEVPDESMKKTIMVALAVCIACSVLVSTAAVSLQGIQKENIALDRIRNILIAADLPAEGKDIRKVYENNIEPRMIDLTTGRVVDDKKIIERLDIERFNIPAAAGDPDFGRNIPGDRDIAGIKRMPRYMVIYFMRNKEKSGKVILPVYGKGLWSTMYGLIALADDLKTVTGFTFYAHAETPGLGGEVDNPKWKESWKGKQVLDSEGNVSIRVVKGRVDNSRPEAMSRVDGLSGATITSRGVENLLHFWLGEQGYGPLLNRLREGLYG